MHLRNAIVTWAVLTLSLWAAAKVVPGIRIRGGLAAHFVVSAIFGVLMVVLEWLLTTVFVIGTLGLGALLPFLTMLAVSTVILKLTDAVTDQLEVKSWKAAFFASIVIALVGALASWVLA